MRLPTGTRSPRKNPFTLSGKMSEAPSVRRPGGLFAQGEVTEPG